VQRLGVVKRELVRLVDALAEGVMTTAAVRDKLAALEAERLQLEATLAAPQRNTDVISLHPGATARYLEQIENLAEALKAGLGRPASSADWFRSLIDKVIVHPVPARAVLDIEVRGYMAQLIGEPRLLPNRRFSGGNAGSGGQT
jgi:site-specific DNA recombinase